MPIGAVDQPIKADTPAAPGAAAFASTALFDDHRNVQPAHGAGIADSMPVGAQYLDLLQGRSQRGGHLYHPRIKVAHKGIHLFQCFQFYRKCGPGNRIIGGIEVPICGLWRIGHRTAAIANGQARRFSGTTQCGFADFCRMRIAGHLAPHGAQSKTLRRIITGCFEPPIVINQRF